MSFKRYEFIEGLTSLHGSGNKILINNAGQIKDPQGNDLTYDRDAEGHQTVVCPGWDGIREYRVIDLVALQFKNLRIGVENFGAVQAFVIDGNKDNTHAGNVGYRFKNGKLESKSNLGFFYVPGFTSMVINSSGHALDVKSSKEKTWYVTKPGKRNITGGYRNTSVSVNGVASTVGRHRALCLVFKDYPDNVDSLVTNHVNGIPGDDWLDNLEWATYSRNTRHAFENNLRFDNKRILIRNALKNEVTEYYSMSECVKGLGLSGSSVIPFRLKAEFGKVFWDGTQIKLKDDPRPWVIPEDPRKEMEEAKGARTAVLARNCLTGKVFDFISQNEASRFTGVSVSAINLRCVGKTKCLLFGWQFELKEEFEEWMSFTQEEFRQSMIPGTIGVSARNLLTGEERTYESVRQAEVDVGSGWTNNVLNSGRQQLLSSGWQLKYQIHPWEEIPDFEEALYKLRAEVTARRESDGAIFIANNAAQMAGVLGLNVCQIRPAALTRGNKVFKGYRFRLGTSLEDWPSTLAAKTEC